MAHRANKRKHGKHATNLHDDAGRVLQPEASLVIQAHEADLVRGPQAAAAAGSLEVVRVVEDGKVVFKVGDGLIRWGGRAVSVHDQSEDEHFHLRVGSSTEDSQYSPKENEIWVDRYDCRLLVDTLPTLPATACADTAEPDSPGGWSDIPSDAEDTFFLSQEEVEDYRREKRRRVIHDGREARLRALQASGDADDTPPADPREDWGGSDEEPDDAQKELMRRTASHVLASPNAAQLEMRILANHGTDPRFAFLRGRWSRAWRLAKTKVRVELEEERSRELKKKTEVASGGRPGIGALAGYGDSDEDEDQDEPTREDAQDVQATTDETKGAPSSDVSDDAVKAARRARAREWAEKRRAMKESGGVQEDS
ncbi:hypothetical protein GY45DRAFT_1329876 [Cubamyces sp. BRFM 1775]|nr:hypothetical protein GY45DRAFT_1329876 [Cubamyces sp. BRFM 1775]